MSYKSFLTEATRLLGTDWVLTDPALVACYARDASVAAGTPQAVLLPGSTAEVAAVMKIAAKTGVPVTPRGAGTGLAGGAVAAQGIVLALTRLRALAVHPEDRVAVAGAGVTTATVHTAAAAAGLFYPPDPSSASVATIGGNIATNAGGPHGFKYGVTRDYVLGLEAVLADGTVIQTGGRTLKNATGYDLTGLLCGSEGTLAIITGAILRLLPLPEATAGLVAAFSELEAAAQGVITVTGAGIVPAALELIDRTALSCAAPALWTEPPAAVLWIEIDGPAETVSRQVEEAATLCRQAGASSTWTAAGKQREEFYQLRRNVSGALVRRYPAKIGEDVVVPVSRVPAFIRSVVRIGAETGLAIAVFGHAADGNLHPNILFDPQETDPARVEAAISAIFREALACGGTLSGEHGVGILKAPYFEAAVGKECVRIMRGIKAVFDPRGLLNPGKIWPAEGVK
ncbi:glycolate oxidase [Thermodesulfitimonas autotrophica]|uniref:Glycolate oxidase n=1 Tax=Thermodesulfitimonas autotrophica TaxID=1894989 RepID=A0A3N5AY41_9THEO|nr:FAD-linked oxidase C-terminal domain-containing protein [Thermodesulfitimonas autotrophica]RPF49833.1 glycolate oxidase [Thermodesulfitimonas autotrophica]